MVTRFTVRGTHNGDVEGIAPTGKAVTITAIRVEQYAAGKVVEAWENFDELGMLQQIGAIAPASGA